MEPEIKKITCPDCGEDNLISEVQDGRCPKCEFPLQQYINDQRIAQVRARETEKERKDREAKEKLEQKSRNSGLRGIVKGLVK